MIIDDGGLVSEALARADLVIAQKSLGVIGHLNSEISIEAAKKYSHAGIVEISPASTSVKLTDRPESKDYVYRTIGTDAQLGEVAAEYIKSNDKYKKVAVLYNDRPYGVSVSSEFLKALAKDPSKEVVLNQTIPVRTSDHSATAAKVAQSQADIIFFIGEYNDAGYLLNALKTIAPNIQFLGSEGVHHQEFIKIAKANSEGALIIGAAPAPKSIEDKYEAKYHRPISGYVSTSYKATKLLLDAIKASNFKNSKEVAKIVGENTVFNTQGDLIKPEFVMYHVQAMKFVI
jgi:branched-chain amino acid transport system substrate-binding protein